MHVGVCFVEQPTIAQSGNTGRALLTAEMMISASVRFGVEVDLEETLIKCAP